MDSRRNKQTRHKVAIRLDRGHVEGEELVYMFIAPDQRVTDVLNDEREFLPFERADGTVFAVAKRIIRCITPMETGLRVGGAVELGGLHRPPNYARSRAMLDKARRFLPGLDASGGREWMGYRPSLPDSLPVIGRSRGSDNIFYAFGHGHLGLTQAAATGRLVHDLVTGARPAIDLQPFSPQRF